MAVYNNNARYCAHVAGGSNEHGSTAVANELLITRRTVHMRWQL